MKIEEKLQELGTAFEEFKKTNDKRLEEIKTNGKASAELETKLAKIEADIQAKEKQIEQLSAALNRSGQGGSQKEAELKEFKAVTEKQMGRKLSNEDVEVLFARKDEFNQFLRKGEHMAADQSFRSSKAMSVDSEVGGGFFVQPEVSSEIVKFVHEGSPIRQLASVQTISSASLKINSDLDRPASGWVGERAARTASTPPTVKQDEIFAHEMYAYPEATQQFLDDAAINVEAWLSEFCGKAFALDEATAFISGDGVKRPRGILSYASGTSYGQIERATTEGTGALVANDLIEVQTKLKEPYQKGASWLINRTLIGAIRKIKDVTSGQYIWQPGLQESTPNMLLGNPVYMAADMTNSVATASTDVLLYGDFKAGYQIVDRIGIRVLRDPFTNKPMVGFYTTKRVGGAVKNYEAIKVLRMHA